MKNRCSTVTIVAMFRGICAFATRSRILLHVAAAIALAVASIPIPTAAAGEPDAPKLVHTIRFEVTGDGCLKGQALHDAQAAMNNLVLPPGAKITLVAYSDDEDFKRSPSRKSFDCLNHSLPDGLVDHARLAVARGLHVRDIAIGAGHGAFGAAPAFFFENTHLNNRSAGGLVAIVALRSASSGPGERRVEVWVSGATSDSQPGTTLPPVVLVQTIQAPAPATEHSASSPVQASLDAPSPPPLMVRMAWPTLGVGLAVVASGVVMLVVSANETGAAATARTDAEHQDDTRKGSGFGIGGGAALGLGGSLIALGIVGLATPVARRDPVRAYWWAPSIGGITAGGTF